MTGRTFDDTIYEREQAERLRERAKPNGACPPEAEKPARLRLVPPSEMDWRGAQLDLVKGLLGQAMMALLYGASGSAKTLIALSIALHVALGWPWCGRKVKRGLVVYLAPEGGHSVHLRFHAWCRFHGIDPTDDTLLFRTIPVRVDLCRSDADLREIVGHIQAAEPELGRCVLAVVDTVSRALDGGNENAPDDMGAFVANCDRLREATGATILAVHHTPMDRDTPRGHTALKNGSEIRMLAKSMSDGLFMFTLDHLKDGKSGSELLFKLQSATVGFNEDGETVEGGLVVHTSVQPAGVAGNPRGKLTDSQMRLLQELQRRAKETRIWDFSAEEFSELCVRSGAVDGAKPDNHRRARVHQLRMQLANRKAVAVNGSSVRLLQGWQ